MHFRQLSGDYCLWLIMSVLIGYFVLQHASLRLEARPISEFICSRRWPISRPDTGWTNHNHASDMERFQYDDWQRSTAKAVLLTTKLDAAAEMERTVEAILTALLLLHTSCPAPQDKQSNLAVKMQWELRANQPDVSSEGSGGQNRAEREEREY